MDCLKGRRFCFHVCISLCHILASRDICGDDNDVTEIIRNRDCCNIFIKNTLFVCVWTGGFPMGLIQPLFGFDEQSSYV